MVVTLMGHWGDSRMQVAQTGVMRSCGGRLVDTGQTGVVVVMKKVRETGVGMERVGVPWGRVQSEGVHAGAEDGTRTGA